MFPRVDYEGDAAFAVMSKRADRVQDDDVQGIRHALKYSMTGVANCGEYLSQKNKDKFDLDTVIKECFKAKKPVFFNFFSYHRVTPVAVDCSSTTNCCSPSKCVPRFFFFSSFFKTFILTGNVI